MTSYSSYTAEQSVLSATKPQYEYYPPGASQAGSYPASTTTGMGTGAGTYSGEGTSLTGAPGSAGRPTFRGPKSLGRDRPDAMWMKVFYAVFAILVPPITVGVKTGDPCETGINILWWILGWFPGCIHALLVAFSDTRCTCAPDMAMEPTPGDLLQGMAKKQGVGTSTTTSTSTTGRTGVAGETVGTGYGTTGTGTTTGAYGAAQPSQYGGVSSYESAALAGTQQPLYQTATTETLQTFETVKPSIGAGEVVGQQGVLSSGLSSNPSNPVY